MDLERPVNPAKRLKTKSVTQSSRSKHLKELKLGIETTRIRNKLTILSIGKTTEREEKKTIVRITEE